MPTTTTPTPRRALRRLLLGAVPALLAANAAFAQGCAAPEGISVEALQPDGIVGQGPFGEAPATIESVALTSEQSEAARAGGFRVGVVMQTMDIDWSRLVVQGITDTLAANGVELVGVTDPGFQVDRQVAQIGDMIQLAPDAIISIPVDNTATAAAYKGIAAAGIKLILMHQVPQGLEYPRDYQAVISPDNRGNGQVAAEILAARIPQGGVVGIVDFGVDFFTTNERTRQVRDWFAANRPDVELRQVDFIDTTKAGDVAANFLTANPDVNGLFVVWDAPAMQVVSAMRAQGLDIPVTSIDLGLEVAMEMAHCGQVVGVSAQDPYAQGVAEAQAAIQVLLGNQPPPWIVLPAMPVLPSNLLESYETVTRAAPPAELVEACAATEGCR